MLFRRCGSRAECSVSPQGEYTYPWLPVVILGAMSLLGSGASLFLPETLNTQLPDTIGEQRSSSQNLRVQQADAGTLAFGCRTLSFCFAVAWIAKHVVVRVDCRGGRADPGGGFGEDGGRGAGAAQLRHRGHGAAAAAERQGRRLERPLVTCVWGLLPLRLHTMRISCIPQTSITVDCASRFRSCRSTVEVYGVKACAGHVGSRRC